MRLARQPWHWGKCPWWPWSAFGFRSLMHINELLSADTDRQFYNPNPHKIVRSDKIGFSTKNFSACNVNQQYQCRNGARCQTNNFGGFTCVCTAGYRGTYCEQRKNPWVRSDECKNVRYITRNHRQTGVNGMWIWIEEWAIVKRVYLMHNDEWTFTSMDTKIGSPIFHTWGLKSLQ